MASWWRGGGSSGGRMLRGAAAAAWRRVAAAGYYTIQAVPRERTGCRAAARERADGRIPAVVLSPGDGGAVATRKQILTADSKQIRIHLKKNPFFCSTVYMLRVRAGPGSSVVLSSGSVLPIKVHRNEETGQVLNLVMAWAEDGTEMKVDVPLVFKGEDDCPGLKKGGYLQKIRTSLKYLCPAEHIPQKIEVDLTNLDVGDRIVMSEIQVHPSLKLLSKNDTMPICKILPTMPAKPIDTPAPATTETPKLNEV
ncbi:50S ribosomal protein L25 [Dioscorea cayenensis subsp. rotundata]|uniref:50S ribosomal protein L25 n=1 Tax=Dioscorea cayennensis subsp. rotundata TaxID=55577 RepID=A0AB40CHS4_DIOCR|nr:50S ribosomal protein L25 [Dioscorea cayenensis subsp. rotundata]